MRLKFLWLVILLSMILIDPVGAAERRLQIGYVSFVRASRRCGWRLMGVFFAQEGIDPELVFIGTNEACSRLRKS